MYTCKCYHWVERTEAEVEETSAVATHLHIVPRHFVGKKHMLCIYIWVGVLFFWFRAPGGKKARQEATARKDRKEGTKEGRKEVRKEGSTEGEQEGRKEGGQEGRKGLCFCSHLR